MEKSPFGYKGIIEGVQPLTYGSLFSLQIPFFRRKHEIRFTDREIVGCTLHIDLSLVHRNEIHGHIGIVA